MLVKLEKAIIFDENYNKIEFKNPIENTYEELKEKWKKKDENYNKIDWKLEFGIYDKKNNKIGEFYLDTENEIIANIDLDGYFNGESLEIEDGIEVKLIKKDSGLLEAMIYSELVRNDVLDENHQDLIYMNLFPEWLNGLLIEKSNENEVLKKFKDYFLIIFEKYNIIKVLDLNKENYEIICYNDEIKDEFKSFLNKTLKKYEFILHQVEYEGNIEELFDIYYEWKERI
ncbi:hypothetical protein EV215_0496 [Hypnocyclicus thermotrophus]|uniref:Uncharacterized protein n=1 Tax=Hypnocyclicus thermotrophus TaxID=1627895 RepID=A0AA46DZG4_9FUSO|nr:hypothetical protein [Hypnocyclicus thermotrophus]TDT71812.1 hypothetical protein EV215_0496 [Hypnocyclicus thermotrophus]